MVVYIEGVGGFDGEGCDLQVFYVVGVCSIGLFWNIVNCFGSGVNGLFFGSLDIGSGLIVLGIDLIKQVNVLKMQIDVFYMNEKVFWDIVYYLMLLLVVIYFNVYVLCLQLCNLIDQ